MDHLRRSSELERGVEELERRTSDLESRIQAARQDWEAKKGDASLPGAQPEGADPANGAGGGDEQASSS